MHKLAFDSIKGICLAPESREAKAKQIAQFIRQVRSYRWTGLYGIEGDEIVAIAWTGADPPAFRRFPKTQGLCGAAVESRESVVVGDVSSDNRYLVTFGSTKSEMIVPVVSRDGRVVIGLIDVESERRGAFSDEDRTFVEVCGALAVGLWE